MTKGKPAVWKDVDGAWVAELDLGSWVDVRAFDAWERALEHALWLGWCANGRP